MDIGKREKIVEVPVPLRAPVINPVPWVKPSDPREPVPVRRSVPEPQRVMPATPEELLCGSCGCELVPIEYRGSVALACPDHGLQEVIV